MLSPTDTQTTGTSSMQTNHPVTHPEWSHLYCPTEQDLTEDWPRGSYGPHHANKEAGKEEQTVFCPGVTKVVPLESCCLLVINGAHRTNRKKNPTGEVKNHVLICFASCKWKVLSNF